MTTSTDETTSAVAPQVRGGDVSGLFEAAYAQNVKGLRALVYRLCGDWHLAEDLVEDVFVQFWQQLREGREFEERGNLFPLLARRARWAVGQYYRKAAVQREQLTAAVAEYAEDSEFESATAHRLQVGQVLAMLPPAQRRAVALRYLEDLPASEIAAQTGKAQQTVSEQLNKGMATLRRELGAPQRTARAALADVREEAVEVYRVSVKAGNPLSLVALAAQFGRTPRWAASILTDSGDYQPHHNATESAKTALREELAAGVYRPGEKLPTTAALAERFGMWPGNVARLLRELAAQGLVERRGAGRNAAGYYAVGAVPALVTNTYLVTGRVPTGRNTFPTAQVAA